MYKEGSIEVRRWSKMHPIKMLTEETATSIFHRFLVQRREGAGVLEIVVPVLIFIPPSSPPLLNFLDLLSRNRVGSCLVAIVVVHQIWTLREIAKHGQGQEID
jgi:NADPH-dependent 2,4-dienoyl-CoA reductase/sulfur reductase-like enzyme